MVQPMNLPGLSLSLRRAWIEIYGINGWHFDVDSRSPYGERGLKLLGCEKPRGNSKSLSLRRAWIEMYARVLSHSAGSGRSPYGERGLKYMGVHVAVRFTNSRSPYGERGLKYLIIFDEIFPDKSLSLRRAWIEIGLAKAPPIPSLSLSLRRAWIEIIASCWR